MASGQNPQHGTDRFRGTMPPASVPPELLFVTGASRSGTTMLARLLGAHSRILALKELHFFGSIWEPWETAQPLPDNELIGMAATLFGRQKRGLWEGKPTAAEREKARDLISRLAPGERTAPKVFAAVLRTMAREEGKHVACEQTPRNIFYARQLLSLYPLARIIHIVRDPRAVLASQKNRWKMRQLGAHHLPLHEMLRNRVNYHPVTMTRLWCKATEEALGLSDHERVLTVRFEDLAVDAEGSARKICDFVGVAFEPPMLDLPRWGSSNLTHSSAEKGISKQVVDQWRKTLPAAHALVCEKMAGPLMQHFGYQPEHSSKRNIFATLPTLIAYPLHAAAVVAFNPGRAWIQLKALRRARS